MAGSQMIPSSSSGWRASATPQVILAIVLSLACAPFLFTNPEMLLVLALVPFLPRLMSQAATFLLLFICFSFFRLHEAYPFLEDASLPLILGSAGIVAFGYTAFNRSFESKQGTKWQGPAVFSTAMALGIGMTLVDPSAGPTLIQRAATLALAVFASLSFYSWFRLLEETDGKWGGEMRAFAALFIILTLEVPFARELGIAQTFWSSTFWKIAATTLALAWLLRTQKLFELATAIIVTAGVLVAAVVIYNGLNGLSLVEGTRVSIGRVALPELASGEAVGPGNTLGDPNDLALVLLFPLGFAVACAFKAGLPWLLRLLCFIALPCISLAIVYTQSRGGAIGMLAVLAVAMINLVKSRTIVFAILSGAAVALVLGMALADRQSGGAAEYSAAGIDASAEGRLIAWEAATKMAIAHPFMGVGMNNFVSHYFEYTPVWAGRNKAVHSTWFAMLAEGGPLALTIFVAMLYRAFRGIHGIGAALASKPELVALEPVRVAILAALAGFATASSFLTMHIQWPLYIQLAMAAALIRFVQLKSAPAVAAGVGFQTTAPRPGARAAT